MRRNERAAFEMFATIRPNFAERPITWAPGADPPDVLCRAGAARIGVELAEWLDEWQIAQAKRDEQEADSYQPILLRARAHEPKHLREVWMVPAMRLDQSLADRFEQEFFAFIREIDIDWPNREDNDDPQGVDVEDFAGYPTVGKYLTGLECYATERACPSRDWLNMYGNGAGYDPQDAVDALIVVFRNKCEKYSDLHANQQLDELYLLLYYDQAWQYNTPYEAPGWSFCKIAGILADIAKSEHGAFDKIFLFDSVNRRVAAIWRRPIA